MNESKRFLFKPKYKTFWAKIPSLPGVYVFEDKNKTPLYIGKSVSLKHRLKQHLQAAKDSTSKQSIFTQKTKYINITTTVNDLIAVLLEAELIKLYTPKYNAIQKDNKSAPYIVITNLPHQRILTVRGQDLLRSNFKNPKTQVFGPFLSKHQVYKILKSARHTFGYCQKPFNSTSTSCFYFHLKSCPGACNGQLSELEYQQHMKLLKSFFQGKVSGLKRTLTKHINQAAKQENFELASTLKEKLTNLEYLTNTPKTSQLFSLPSQNQALMKKIAPILKHPLVTSTPQRIECYDAAHLQTTHYTGSMSVVENGMLAPDQYRLFKLKGQPKGDPQALKEIIQRRLKHTDWPTPDIIVLDGGVGQLSTVFPVVPDPIATIALSKSKETLHFYNHQGKLVNLNLPLSSPVLNLFRLLRDESHRLATSLHKKSRQKALVV
jgi:excinuclease UvrABC nuclease subunit